MLPEVKPVTPAGVWANAANQEIRSNTPGRSVDSLKTTSHNGTTTKAKSLSKINPTLLSVPTAYDYDAAYGIGDMVYITIAQQPYWSAYEFINGIWICVKNVPSNKYSAAIAAQYGGQYKRETGVNYYPVYPLPAEDNRYWLLFSIFPEEMTVCENKVNKTFWVAATHRSGSI